MSLATTTLSQTIPPPGMPNEAAAPAFRTRWVSNAERRNARVRLAALDVRGVFDNRVPFRAIDVSEGGMCVETDRPLPHASGAVLRFDHSDLALPVRVAWTKLVQVGVSGTRYRAGLQFLEPRFEQIRTLLELTAA